MSVEKARAYYLGKPGHKRLNCAQAIIGAFQDKFSLPEDMVARFGALGGGRAPEGHCGSFYAARMILADRYPDALENCESLFLQMAGSTRCRDIRASGKLSCLGCVEKVAECVDRARA